MMGISNERFFVKCYDGRDSTISLIEKRCIITQGQLKWHLGCGMHTFLKGYSSGNQLCAIVNQ
jgi:hypothetical protein